MSEKGKRYLSDFVASGALKIQNGFPCGNWNDKGDGVLHLRPFNITDGGQIDFAVQKFIETDCKLDNFLLKYGDIIFNNTNSEVLVGKTAYWARIERSVLSNHMTILRVVDPDALNAQFLAFYLLLKWNQGHFKSICQRHVNQASVGKERLGALSLPLIELPEQKKIAYILSTVQQAVEEQARIIATTTELKKALMQKLFTEGLKGEPQKQTEIGPVPESWVIKKVGEIATLKSGGTPSRKKDYFWNGGDIPWVKTGQVNYCTILDTEEKITRAGLDGSSARLFPVGTLLMAMYGQGITRGKVAKLGIEASTNQACVAIFPSEEVTTDYLYYVFEHNYESLRRFGHGANQKNLSADIIKTFMVAYPAYKEDQLSIAAVLEKVDKKINSHSRKKASYQELFRTLLHELMTAKIRVNEVDLHDNG